MTWILLQLLCSVCIVIVRIFCREYGLTLYTFLACSFIYVGILSWAIPISFNKAPTFFQPYFLSIVFLSLSGFIISSFYFHDKIFIINWIGAFLALIGSFLIIWR